MTRPPAVRLVALAAALAVVAAPAALAQDDPLAGDTLAAPAPPPPAAPGLETVEVRAVEIVGASGPESEGLARAVAGIQPGQRVQLPWDPSFAEAVRNLYSRGGYSDVQIEAAAVTDAGVDLRITVEEQPRLGELELKGLGSSEREEVADQIPLLRGRAVRPADVERGRMAIEQYVRDQGFQLATVGVSQSVGTDGRVNLTYTVDKGGRVTVADVRFEGNEVFSERTLRKQLKNTPERRWWRFWSRETFDRAGFEEDLTGLLQFYRDRGYYGARVVRDSIYVETPEPGVRDLVVEIEVEEGPQYAVRNVVFEGNTIFTDAQLQAALGVVEGDVYDGGKLERNLYYTPDHSDVTSLYQDRGYLRFDVQQEVVEAAGDSLDLYFEVTEGEVYEFGTVRIAGNTRTKEHVIRREIRTVPGQPYSRAALERSVRELATLNYFDPASFQAGPQIAVNDEDQTVDLTYNLAETSSDQLELSGGWGGGNIGLILTARVTFNNFSIQNAVQGRMPTGDGQQLSLQVQTYGTRRQVYSVSFTEPWFRGRQTPAGFSLGYSASEFRQFGGDDIDVATGYGSLFYRQRLKWPDDFFVTGTNLGFRLYDISGTGGAGLSGGRLPEGVSTEVTVTQTLSRNALDNPTFPQSGSSLDLSATVAPPLGGTVQYYKLDGQTAWYTPVAGRLTASVRAQAGYIGSLTGDEVQFQRYLIGGTPLEASQGGFGRGFGRDLVFLRGYPLEAIGPRRDGAPVGGRILNKYEAELGLVLLQTPQLSLAPYLFADAANTWDGLDDYDPSRLFRSAGVGARVFLPILGLVDLSMGYQIDRFEALGDESGDPGWRFQFSLGGR
jgi:outer membrane protein insertion porin family